VAVAFVRQQFSGKGNSSSFTPMMPAGIAADDLLVMGAFIYQSGAPTLPTPSGWTKIIDGDATFGAGSGSRFYVFTKKAVASEPSPTLTPTTAAYFAVLVQEYSGQDLTTPTDGTASHATPAAGSAVANPALTTGAANSLLLYFEADTEGVGCTITVPAGATQRHNAVETAFTGFRIVASDKPQASAGTVAATSHARTTTSATAIGATMAIKVLAVFVPVADFTATPLTGTASLAVAFTDTSTNTPTSWLWDFGDGTTSTAQNPTHSYTTGGVYSVSLTATNTGGSNTKTRTAYITVSEAIALVTGGGIEIY
jgi:hypothetical protein